MKITELNLQIAQDLEMKLQDKELNIDKVAQIKNKLAYIYFVNKNYELSLEYCNQALTFFQQNPTLPDPHFLQLQILIIRALAHQGTEHFKLNSTYLNEALEYCNELEITLDDKSAIPANHRSMLNLAILQVQVANFSSLLYEGLLQKIEQDLDQAVQDNLEFNAYLHEHLATIYQKIAGEEPKASIKAEQLNQAQKHLDKAIDNYCKLFGEEHQFISGLIDQRKQIEGDLVEIKKKEEIKFVSNFSLFAKEREPSDLDLKISKHSALL